RTAAVVGSAIAPAESSTSNPAVSVAGFPVTGGPASKVSGVPVPTSMRYGLVGASGDTAIAINAPSPGIPPPMGARASAIGNESKVAEKLSPQPAVTIGAAAARPTPNTAA